MFPLVYGQVDELGRLATALEGAFKHRLRPADERHHRAVMRSVGFDIQHTRSGHRADGRYDRIDHVLTPAFAEVRNAFDQVLHELVS